MEIDSLFVSMGLKTEGLQKGFDKAESLMKFAAKRMVKVLAPLASGAMLASAFSSYIDGAAAVKKSADAIGMSVGDLQAWQGAAESLGAEGDEVMGVLEKFGGTLTSVAKGAGGPAAEALRKMGVTATDSAGQARPMLDVLLDLAAAGEGMSQQQLESYAETLGLDASAMEMLHMGKKGLQELVQAEREMAAYTDADAAIAEAWSKSMGTLQKGLDGITSVIMREVGPAINYIADGVSNFVMFLRKNEGFTKAFFAILGTLVAALGIKMAIAFAPMVLTVGAIGAAIAAVALIVDDFLVYLDGGESALEGFWSVFGTGEEISAALAKTWETLQAVGVWLWDTLSAGVDDFFQAFGPLFDALKTMFSGAAEFFVGLFTLNFEKMGDGLVTYFGGAIDAVAGLFTGLVDFIWSGIEGLLGGLVSGAKKLISLIPGMGGSDDDDEEDEGEGLFSAGVKKVTSLFGWGGDDEVDESGLTNAEKRENVARNLGAQGNGGDGSVGMGASQADAIAVNTPSYNQGPQVNNTQNTQSNNFGNITINTNATDANGIARDIQPAINNNWKSMAAAANMGVMK